MVLPSSSHCLPQLTLNGSVYFFFAWVDERFTYGASEVIKILVQLTGSETFGLAYWRRSGLSNMRWSFCSCSLAVSWFLVYSWTYSSHRPHRWDDSWYHRPGPDAMPIADTHHTLVDGAGLNNCLYLQRLCWPDVAIVDTVCLAGIYLSRRTDSLPSPISCWWYNVLALTPDSL